MIRGVCPIATTNGIFIHDEQHKIRFYYTDSLSLRTKLALRTYYFTTREISSPIVVRAKDTLPRIVDVAQALE